MTTVLRFKLVLDIDADEASLLEILHHMIDAHRVAISGQSRQRKQAGRPLVAFRQQSSFDP